MQRTSDALQVGEENRVYRKGGRRYVWSSIGKCIKRKVDQIKTVEPHETEDIQIVPGEDYVTLVTCTPYSVNTHRLLVRGTRIDYMEAKQVQPDEVETILYFPDEVKLLGIATVAIGILLIIVNIWRRRRHGKRQKKRRYRRHT